jgi:hypothetical protein
MNNSNQALVNRNLGAMEKIFWLLDQTSQVHFVIAAEIIGTKTIAQWREALSAVQERHLLLSVSIKNNGFVHPTFHHDNGAKIPLRIVEEKADYHWEQELEKELATPFDWTKAPLVRTVLVQESIFIFTSHHAIGDGMSGLIFIHDLLTALDGKQLLPLQTPFSSDTLLGITNQYDEIGGFGTALTDTIPDEPVFIRREELVPVVDRLQLSPEFTLHLYNHCKAQGTTVHGALCAAFVLAGRKINQSG